MRSLIQGSYMCRGRYFTFILLGDIPLIKNSVVGNLIGFWDFEETRLLNEGSGALLESENSEFAETPRGPAYIGGGMSAFFDGNHFIAIDHNSAELNSPAWTYSFWMFLI
jgi:hypothetical protein